MFTFIHFAQIIIGISGAYFTLRLIIDIITCTAVYMKDEMDIMLYTKSTTEMLKKDGVLIIVIWTIFIQLL